MVLPIENGDWKDRLRKGINGLGISGDTMIGRENIAAFEQEHARRNYYGCLHAESDENAVNLNFASIPHATEVVHAYADSVRSQLLQQLLSLEDREQFWHDAREKACQLINHPDPRGVLLAGNTTQAMSFFHWLSGMMHGKNRTGLLHHVLTTDIENSATIRTICTVGEDGNPHGRDKLTTYSDWNVSTAQEGKRTVGFTTYTQLRTKDCSLEDIKQQLEKLLKPSLTLATVPDTIVLSHVDRHTGRELPVKEIIACARALKVKADPYHPHLFCVVDGAQALGNIPKIDWNDIGADMYAISPHKTLDGERLGIVYFNPENPLVQDGLKLLHPEIARYQPIYHGTFHPDLGVSPNVEVDGFYEQMTGIHRAEINPVEVAAFVKTVEELEEQGYLSGNDFSELDAYRRTMKLYCQQELEGLSKKIGVPITAPQVESPTNFILSICIGQEKAPKRKLPLLQRYLPNIWRPEQPEQFGHEVGRRLQEHGIAVTYFSEPNIFRLSFDRNTTQESIDRFIHALEEVLSEFPELQPRAVS
jgi:selenocysteine lyase/cysteine desulfurase